MKYESFEEMSEAEILEMLSSESASNEEKAGAVYSAIYFREVSFAVDCVLRAIGEGWLSPYQSSAVATLMEMRRTNDRSEMLIEALRDSDASEADVREVLEIRKFNADGG